MRKNFLLLFLMALLPLAALAQDITVTPIQASKSYGDADPGAGEVKTGWFSTSDFSSITGVAKNDIASALKFWRITAGETVGTYEYSYEDDTTVNDGTNDHDLLINGKADFYIKQKDISTFTQATTFTNLESLTAGQIALVLKNPIYTDGTAKKPGKSDITIYVKNAVASTSGELAADQYDIVADGYSNNTAAGTATLKITGKGNYAGTITLNFTILKTDLGTFTATWNTASTALVYNGSDQTPTASDFVVSKTVSGTTTTLNAGTDYEIKAGSYKDNKNAGNATVVLQAKSSGSYDGELTASFAIAQKEVTTALTIEKTDPTYTGSAVLPTISSVTDGSLTLTKDKDYTITTSSVNAGAATATIAFKGNFKGTAQTVNYTINKQSINDSKIVIAFTEKNADKTEKTQYEYDNDAIKPAYTVTFKPDSKTSIDLTSKNAEIKVEYKDASDGTNLKSVENGKKLIVTGLGVNFSTDLKTKTYDVIKRTVTLTTEDLSVGTGADVNPTVAYGTFAKNESATTLGLTPTFKYKALNADGNETGSEIAQADIKSQAVGKYHIIPSIADDGVDGKNTAALKNYNFVELTDAESATVRGTLTKTQGQVILQVARTAGNEAITYGDNFPTDNWTLTHVSGLAPDAVASFISGLTIDQAKFELVTPVTGKLNANEEGYAVKYTGTFASSDYAITVTNGKLIVNKKKIAATDIAINPKSNTDLTEQALTYTGAAQYPTVKVKSITGEFTDNLLPTNYYTTAYDEDYSAGTRTAKITIVGDGAANYVTETEIKYTAEEADAYNTEHGLTTGDPDYKTTTSVKEVANYVEKTYTINKKVLTIASANFTGENGWTYGQEAPNYLAAVTITGMAESDAAKVAQLKAGEQPEDFFGTLTIKLTDDATVGEHAKALKPVFVTDNGTELTAANIAKNYTYTSETVTNGDLTINKGKIVAKVKDITYPYGETTPTFQLEAVSGLSEEEAANFDAIVSYDKTLDKYSYNAEACAAIGEYTIEYKGAAPTATNYDVEYAEGATAFTGKLTVVKRPVKFAAKSYTGTDAVAYNAITETWETTAKTVNATNITQTTDTEYLSLLGEDDVTTVIASISFTKNIGDNDIVLTPKESDIYDITVEKGTLTITKTGVQPIVLNRVAKASYTDENSNTAAKLIKENDGKIVDVTFSSFALTAEKWYPLVLPFATSVKDISAAFGYAVVDIFDGTDADGNIQFKLHMGNIDANTPFIVKVYEDENMSDATVKFNNVTIVNAMDDNKEVKVGDAAGVQFVGTYAGRVDGFRSNMYYFSTNNALNEYYKGNDTNTTYLRPLGAYFLDNSADAASANRMIIIEEPNGNTTKISAITAEGASIEADGWYTVSGVRLEGAPTEKGVYIRNGKKVVLK